MHDLPILVNIALALAYALGGGLLARAVGLPTIVGYLLAGVALGPWAPGFHGDEAAVRQLAELGVILLMFGVGIHFNFSDLWHVRRVAVPASIAQMFVVTVIGYYVGLAWGFSTGGAWVLGIAVSVASTVVQMRSLMDHGWLNSPAGRVAIGWLVFEDLLTVAVLVLLPVIFAADRASAGFATALIAIFKALLFIALMFVVGNRLVPIVLNRVVHTQSRELFILVALTVAVGTALASATFFGVSLALGAFVAGVVVSESPFSHQISADLLPFREAFAVIFFVSVGMLVNPVHLVQHWDQVLILALLIVVVKGLISFGISVVLPASARTALVLATGRGQIGEFSFIVGQTGITLGLIDPLQYSLILAGGIVSITMNPFVVRLVDPLERRFKRMPKFWRWLNRHGIPDLPEPGLMEGHVVIVGSGRVGRHIAEALGRLNIPRLVIEADPVRLEKLAELGVPVLYGDAGSSEILHHAGLEHATALVITLPDDATVLSVAVDARRQAPKLRIIARASTWDGARRLRDAGVAEIVRPELEGGLEIVRRTLLDLEMPVIEVQRYTELVRREDMQETNSPSAARLRVLDDIVVATHSLQIGWIVVPEHSSMAGRTLADTALRSTVGVSVVAIGRGEQLHVNPGPDDVMQAGDRLAVIGTPAQVAAAEKLFEALAGLRT